MRFRELPVGDPAGFVVVERREAHRSVELLRGGEPGEQPLEIRGSFDPPADLVREHRLSRTRGAHEKNVLTREQGAESSLDDRLAFGELC